MQYTIKNTHLTLTADTKGAQMVSIINDKGEEVLWNGDSTAWGSHAPVLFPYTGRKRDGIFTLDGVEFQAPIHGFIRNIEHTMILKEDNLVMFQTKSTPETRRFFPYDFTFRTSYILSGHSVHHKIDIINNTKNDFSFGLGFHPGFNIPFDNNHVTSDYFLEFDTPQSPYNFIVNENGLLSGKTELFGNLITTIPLSDDMFKNDSLVLGSLNAKTISIVEKASEKRIVFDIQDFPYIVLWSAPTKNMRFLCVEPWLSLPDRFDSSTDWDKKDHYKVLAPDEYFSILSRVKILR